jgi:hypothetical protein
LPAAFLLRASFPFTACGGSHFWGREIGKLGHRVQGTAPLLATSRETGHYFIARVSDQRRGRLQCPATMTASATFAFVLGRPPQGISGDNALLAIAVGPNPVLQAITSVRQVPRYAKVATLPRRPGLVSDMGADVEFMSRGRHDLHPPKSH